MSAAQAATRTYIAEVGTHREAHFDEQAARFLIEEEGRRLYTGLHSFVYYDTSAQAVAAEARDDTLVFGTGGGALDEHKQEGRLQMTCATQLVAEHLGIADLPEYQLILRYALMADTHRDPDTGESLRFELFELPNIVKRMHSYSHRSDHDVWHWIQRILLAMKMRERGDDPFRTAEQLRLVPGQRTLYIAEEARAQLTKGGKGKREDRPLLRRIVLPEFPDFKTIVKALLVQWFGGKKCWRIEGPVRLQFVKHEDQHVLNELVQREGIVFVGIDGGQFGPEVSVRATANKLKVRGLEEVPSFCYTADNYEFGKTDAERPFDLGPLVTLMSQYGKMNSRQIVNFVRDALRSYRDLVRARREAREHFKAELRAGRAQHLEIGDDIVVAMVASDSRAIEGALRRYFKANVLVVFSEGSKRVAINEDIVQMHPQLLHRISRAVLQAEAAKLGHTDIEIRDWQNELDSLFATGASRNMPGLSWWHVWTEGGGLMNGSTTHVAERPSALSPVELGQAVLNSIVAELSAGK